MHSSKPSKLSRQKGLLLINIGQLVTLRSASLHRGPRRGAELSALGINEDGAVLCIGGKIVSVGTSKEALRDRWIKRNQKIVREIDCAGKVVIPGFVDSHTHPAFVGPRLVDFEKRIEGSSYEAIAAAGGGISSSLQGVRQATTGKLSAHILSALQKMATHGTTTVEAKSGYGLTVDSEMKSLAAIRDAASQWPGAVSATLLGAHVVPKEFRDCPQNYVQLVCREMIPRAARQKLAQFVDVFCENIAFTPEQTQQIFAAARECGLHVRAHVGQLSETPLNPLLHFKPASLDHMDYVRAEDLSRLARSETVSTLVPGANYFLGLSRYPDARRLIDSGVAVALATDYNPGTSPTLSMPMAMSLACTHLKMSPAEALAAATINGAHALLLGERKGSIESGKDADLAIFDASDYREIPYWFGVNRCSMTIMNGEVFSHL